LIDNAFSTAAHGWDPWTTYSFNRIGGSIGSFLSVAASRLIALTCFRRAATFRRVTDTESSAALPMSTTFELPGLAVKDNLGVCYGLVVRSMGFTGGVAAGFKALRRGEVSQYTRLLEDSRRHAIDRMVENARLVGADAVIGVRFDSSEIGNQLTEIVAYGTAVTVEPTS
jgi:uncharacterized protein YbjQ (UPF0145 family)